MSLRPTPGDTDTISQLVAHYAKNDPGAAETLLKDVLANPRLRKNSPGYLLAELELGKLYWDKLQQADRAADAFAKVVEALDEKAANRLTPADQKRILGGDESAAASSYLDFGVVFLAAKRYDLAVKAFLRGLVYDEDDPQLPLLLAQTLLKSGKGEEALRADRGIPQTPAAGGRGLRLARQDPDRAASRERDHPPARGGGQGRFQEHPAPVHPGRPLPRDRPGREGRADVQGAAGRAADHSGLWRTGRVAVQAKEDRRTAQGHDRGLTKPGGAEAITPQLDADRARSGVCRPCPRRRPQAALGRSAGPRVKPAFKILTHIAIRAEKLEEAGRRGTVGAEAEPDPAGLPGDCRHPVPPPQVRRSRVTTLEELLEKYPDEKNAAAAGDSWPTSAAWPSRIRRPSRPSAKRSKLDPNDAGAQLLAVVLLSQTGKVDEAIAVGRAALKTDPSNTDFNRTLGYVLTQFGRTDEAIALYKDLLEHYPNNEEIVRLARSGLSVAYVNLNEYAKGEAELEALLQLDPDEAGVNNDLGYLYADQGKNLEKAEAMIRKAVQEDPTVPPTSTASAGSCSSAAGSRRRSTRWRRRSRTSPGEATRRSTSIWATSTSSSRRRQKAKAAWEQAEKAASRPSRPTAASRRSARSSSRSRSLARRPSPRRRHTLT